MRGASERPIARSAGAERGLPLRPTLVTVVGILICLGAGGVGLSAYVSSTRVVDQLFRDLATQIGAATTQRTCATSSPPFPTRS